MDFLVNSREMALELSYVYVKYIYRKEKAEFQKPYSITDDNAYWKIEGKKTGDVRGGFYNTNSEKRWSGVKCNTHKIIYCAYIRIFY